MSGRTLLQTEASFWHDHKYQLEQLTKYYGGYKDDLLQDILECGLVEVQCRMDMSMAEDAKEAAMPLEEYKERFMKVRR